MHHERLAIPDLVLFTPVVHRDERGAFAETFRADRFADVIGPVSFVQDNQSVSGPVGTVRGLHFQIPPSGQGKLVRVLSGAILDVAVDIRTGSPTYGRHAAVELSAENWRQLWIPPGFAHGFATLAPDTVVHYKVTQFYDGSCERGLAWDDPALGIGWPAAPERAVLSAKDRAYPPLADLPAFFQYDQAIEEAPSCA